MGRAFFNNMFYYDACLTYIIIIHFLFITIIIYWILVSDICLLKINAKQYYSVPDSYSSDGNIYTSAEVYNILFHWNCNGFKFIDRLHGVPISLPPQDSHIVDSYYKM